VAAMSERAPDCRVLSLRIGERRRVPGDAEVS
jgi:hypothetical protein